MFRNLFLTSFFTLVSSLGALPGDVNTNRLVNFGDFINNFTNEISLNDSWKLNVEEDGGEVDVMTGKGYTFTSFGNSVLSYSLNVRCNDDFDALQTQLNISNDGYARAITINSDLITFVPILQVYYDSDNYTNVWFGNSNSLTMKAPCFLVFESYENETIHKVAKLNMFMDLSSNSSYAKSNYLSGNLYFINQVSTYEYIGFDVSFVDLNNQYSVGYVDGYNDGLDDGYVQGKEDGFELGYNANNTLLGLFATIADVPINMLYSMFHFEVFGTSLFYGILGFFSLAIMITILIFIIRILIKLV